MITLECAWCESELTIDGLDATRVDCPECNVSVDLAQDDAQLIAVAA
jgi:Zn finger protein HypA/HybF involved in hydrogenase expression